MQIMCPALCDQSRVLYVLPAEVVSTEPDVGSRSVAGLAVWTNGVE